MNQLNVTRHIVYNSGCGFAASATVAKYHGSTITPNQIEALAKKHIPSYVSGTGLDVDELCSVLNLVGFKKVTYLTSDIDVVDYAWKNYSKKKLIDVLTKLGKYRSNAAHKIAKRLAIWLAKEEYDNSLIITYDFAKQIRKALNKKLPVIVCFNWHLLWQQPKETLKMEPDPFTGLYSAHAVVACGYNKSGVIICDSFANRCTCKYIKQYEPGFYHVKWNHLMTAMGFGDIYIAEKFET